MSQSIILKYAVILLLFFVIFNLFSAIKALIKGEPNKLVKSLTWRIGLSVLIFIVLIVCFYFGFLQPHKAF